MEEISSFLKSCDCHKVMLFFIKKTSRQGKNYLLYKAPIEDDLGEMFRDIAARQIEELNKSAEIIDYAAYGDIVGSDQSRIIRINADRVQHLSQIVDELYHFDLEDIDEKKFKNTLGYVVKIQNFQKSLFLFKKSPRAVSLKKKNRLLAFDQGILKQDKRFYVVISAVFDGAYLFDKGSNSEVLSTGETALAAPLYIFNFSRFESLFTFRENYKQEIEAGGRETPIESFLDDPASFFNYLENDVRQLRKLHRIVKYGALSSMDLERIKTVNRDYKLGLLNDQGKIRCDQKNLWTVLRLLNDDYVYSNCTGLKYEARSKLKQE